MSLRNSAESWGWPTRLLHWAVAAIIFFLIGLGLWMSEFVEDAYAKFALVQTHKSWGFVVFALALARICWRLVNPTPDHLPTMGRAERTLARIGHVALYVLMIATPITGWLMASASELQDMYGIRNMVFGLFELPDPFVPGSMPLEAAFRSAHFWCVVALGGIVLVHVGAALRHHFWLRDNVLRRMILGR